MAAWLPPFMIYFSCYSPIEEAILISDKATGKRQSRIYGYVMFEHVDGALLALKEPDRNVDGGPDGPDQARDFGDDA
ncbi:UBP1-associated protein 2C [Morella rubra]|uniref:UBP1-associated protein 2C n=1 Tax=Morella rubra TaxID=262757 RepID=A0A6A1V983_9ROSI|nr:UBP1-associated protein 2C [Morella rubra]